MTAECTSRPIPPLRGVLVDPRGDSKPRVDDAAPSCGIGEADWGDEDV